MITATLGALWLCAFGDAPWGDYSTVWLTWFGGEAAGSLIVGPLVLTWLSAPDPIFSNPATPIEKTAMAVSVAVVSAIVLAYGEHLVSLPYAFIFLFAWVLLRAGLRAAFLAVAAGARRCPPFAAVRVHFFVRLGSASRRPPCGIPGGRGGRARARRRNGARDRTVHRTVAARGNAVALDVFACGGRCAAQS